MHRKKKNLESLKGTPDAAYLLAMIAWVFGGEAKGGTSSAGNRIREQGSHRGGQKC